MAVVQFSVYYNKEVYPNEGYDLEARLERSVLQPVHYTRFIQNMLRGDGCLWHYWLVHVVLNEPTQCDIHTRS